MFSFELCLQMHEEFSQTRGFNKQKSLDYTCSTPSEILGYDSLYSWSDLEADALK